MSVKKGVTFRLLPLLFFGEANDRLCPLSGQRFSQKNPPPIKTTMGKKGWDNTRASFVVGFGKLLRF